MYVCKGEDLKKWTKKEKTNGALWGISEAV